MCVHDDIEQLLAIKLTLGQKKITVSEGVGVRHFSRWPRGFLGDITLVLEPGIGSLDAALVAIVELCEELLSKRLQSWKSL